MRFSTISLIFSLILGFISPDNCPASTVSPSKFVKMLVEYAENPISIDQPNPEFSWIISSGKRNQFQSAYRIMVASSSQYLSEGKPDMWDSGKIISGETIHHEYGNTNLMSGKSYFWKVIFWDSGENAHESGIARFETALLSDKDWQAHWIGNGSSLEKLPPQGFYKDKKEQFKGKDSIVHDGNSLLLRHVEKFSKKIKSARAYVTGLGFYEFFINGTRVGDHVLAPAKTPYHKLILYDTYDVTSLLKQGANAFGIHLGNGWYNPYKKWWNEYRMQWFGSKKAIAQFQVTYADGSSQIITTDKNWVWSHGPVTYNCIYDGEVYDANLDHNGWTRPDYDDSSWNPVTLFDKPNARLMAHRMPAVKIKESFHPKELKVSKSGVKVFDMGQNFAGWVRLTTQGVKNTVLKIRFAEDIKEDGSLDITSNENAGATAEYILKGDGIETYETHFSYFGFKYAEVSAKNGSLNLISIEGRALYSDNPKAGYFESDNRLVNKIHNATIWSQKSNMIGYPMDCPQRDERLGWFGDAQVTAEEAMFNFNMALFYENWFEGIKENQDEKTGDLPIISPRPYIYDVGIEWSSTYLIMLWQYYTFYGDHRMLLRHYATMKRYMSFLDSISNDYILPMGWIGDWGSMVKGWKEGEPKSVPTAYYFLNAKIMSDVARILGNNSDQEYFKNLSAKIKAKYNSTYLNTETANYNDGSQMANSFPLYLGLVPEELKQKVLDNLVKDITLKNDTHLTTGVLGTKYMPEALALMGRSDIAWGIINQKTSPGWNDMMTKYTTMCEFWTLKQSKNHVMMGSIDAWFYKYMAGIRLDESNPAFSIFQVKPLLLRNLNTAKGRIETIRGLISSEWTRIPGRFTLKVEVPFNTTALVYIPGDKEAKISEGGLPLSQVKGIEYLGYSDSCHLVKVHSGYYVFTTGKN